MSVNDPSKGMVLSASVHQFVTLFRCDVSVLVGVLKYIWLTSCAYEAQPKVIALNKATHLARDEYKLHFGLSRSFFVIAIVCSFLN